MHLDPVELDLGDGTVLPDRYWMPKIPRMPDALVPEKSPVSESRSRIDGKVTGWGHAMSFTAPTLRRDVVEDHHIWRLPNLACSEIFVSDWLETEVERRDLKPFKGFPASLD